MNLPDDRLKEVEELAGLFLEPEEIAVLMELDPAAFLAEISGRKGPVYLAYFRGKTLSKKEILSNVVKMARHGSPQAEDLARDFMVKQSMAEKRAKK